MRRILLAIFVISAMLFALSPQLARTAHASSTAPILRLPWMNGFHQITTGYSYNCGDHTNLDAHAIDFSLLDGTKLATVANGVAHLGPYDPSGYGHYIWIAHTNPNGSLNGYVSLYAHMGHPGTYTGFKVSEGQKVKQGQFIGYSGYSGNVSPSGPAGAHLHFSLRSGATTQYDGSSATPEPMSGYTGFGNYGACGTGASPLYGSTVWLNKRYDTMDTGYNPQENILNASNLSKITTKWTNTQFTRWATLNGGILYGNIGGVSAIDTQTGNVLWNSSVATGGNIVSEGTLVFTADLNDVVYAFDSTKCSNGQICYPIWQQGPFDAHGAFYLNVANGILYLSTAVKVYALNVQTGNTIWSKATTGDAYVMVEKNLVYLASEVSGIVSVYNASTGSFIWQSVPIGTPIQPGYPYFYSAAVQNGMVYLGDADGSVYAVNQGIKNAPVHTDSIGTWIGNDVLLGKAKIYVMDHQGNMFAFDIKFASDPTKHHWLWEAPGPGVWSNQSILANGVIYYGSSDGNLYGLDSTSGTQVWKFAPSPKGDYIPLIANGILYALGASNTIAYQCLQC